MTKKRIVHYINQFFAGIGGEEKADTKPESRPGVVGPGMALAKELCNLNAGGGNGAVVNRKLGVSRDSGCGRTESDVSHGEAPTEQGFEPITQAAKQRWWTVQGWSTGSRTGTPSRVSPHGPP